VPDVKETAYAAPALEKGLDILELLSAEEGGLTQNQVAQRLGRSTSEIFRMLNVLERRGYLVRLPDGAYRLTLKLFELAHRHPPIRQLLTFALPRMHELAQRSRQANHLVLHYARRILVVAQVESPEPMGFSVRLGAHFPFRPDRASARVLTAFQPPARQAAMVDEMQANSDRRLARRTLRTELDRVRALGYHMARSDTTEGVTDLCCPVFDHSGMVVAALTVPYLNQRDVTVSVAQARALLVETAAGISAALGAVTAALAADKSAALPLQTRTARRPDRLNPKHRTTIEGDPQ
jgi:DNA-binding IclR family transcriptional regulator